MTEATEYPRGVANRGTNSKGVSTGQGNPGTFLGTETRDGVTYARYRAEKGTWVSASLKELGYDRTYGKDTAYGAYSGAARAPDGSPLTNPDRIKPGQEYLIPISSGTQSNRVATDQTPTNSRSVGSESVQPERANPLDRSPEKSKTAPPEARARQQIAGNRATRSDAPLLGSRQEDREDWEYEVFTSVLRRLAASGTLAAVNGREGQRDQMENVRGAFGNVSDWLNDVEPPYIGAWTNVNNFFIRASENLSTGDPMDALSNILTGYSELFSVQRSWHEYLEESIHGAGKTANDARAIRDLAVAGEIGLATGGLAAPVVGSVGGVLVGGGVGIGELSESDSPAGEAVRGTYDEIIRSGMLANLRLAGQGLIGIAYGIGESMSEIPAALAQLPKTVAKLLGQAGDILITLFRNPAKVVDDMARIPEAVALIFQALDNRWEWLKSLPPEKQAFEIGRLSGHIEATLIVLKAGPTAGAVAGDVAAGTMSAAPKGMNVAVMQLEQLQLQIQGLQAAATAAGTMTAVAMAAPMGGGGSSSDKSGKTPARRPQAGDVISYGDKRRTKKLDRHEVLQNLWLEVNDIISKRGKGLASRENPTLLLPPNVHRVVNRYQRALGLYDKAKMAKLSYKQILSLNALVLKNAGVPQSIIREVLNEALEHAIFSMVRGY